ncbi:hypothetical protein DV515_00017302 [Chloebia gouldiae]|uniref:Uncharacterized protein n=1 Tax=Chloebia gouldiae TaxID=44316 RepID=A0A3L8QW29_CHLGU|nr:hypothetical protein DV515_00017301 [Chloebia gouldiae]RLV71585.1 hypothetical protein DV515_00017302 [Chloebia gouldiae]
MGRCSSMEVGVSPMEVGVSPMEVGISPMDVASPLCSFGLCAACGAMNVFVHNANPATGAGHSGVCPTVLGTGGGT